MRSENAHWHFTVYTSIEYTNQPLSNYIGLVEPVRNTNEIYAYIVQFLCKLFYVDNTKNCSFHSIFASFLNYLSLFTISHNIIDFLCINHIVWNSNFKFVVCTAFIDVVSNGIGRFSVAAADLSHLFYFVLWCDLHVYVHTYTFYCLFLCGFCVAVCMRAHKLYTLCLLDD